MGLITIHTFNDLVEAQIMQARLESEDIPCYLFDEHIVGVNPLYMNTVGGIKLKIDPRHAERAQVIIHAYFNKSLTDNSGAVITCPSCQSENIISGYKSFNSLKGIISAIITFLLLVFPIYYKTMYKCRDCDHTFNH